MQRQRVIPICAILAILVWIPFLLSGCMSNSQESASLQESAKAVPYKKNISTMYTVPQLKTRILVNQLGYRPESDKMVIFLNPGEVTEFSVVNQETGMVAATLPIQEKETQQGIRYYGDISMLTQDGTYYIRAMGIGESHYFRIFEGVYDQLLEDLWGSVANAGLGESLQDRKQEDYQSGMLILLSMYEWQMERCSDAIGIAGSGNGMPDVLDLIRAELDLQISTGKLAGDYESYQQMAVHVGLLAQFYYYFRAYDQEEAKEYLTAAEEGWTYLLSQKEEEAYLQEGSEVEAAVYYATCSLYRSTSDHYYRRILREYQRQNYQGIEHEPLEFYGNLLFLNHQGEGTPTTTMETLMTEMVDRARSILVQDQASIYMVYAEDPEEMLGEMIYLCTIENILFSYEYPLHMERHLQYLLGGNEEVVSYMTGYGEPAENLPIASGSHLAMDSILIYMIYEITK